MESVFFGASLVQNLLGDGRHWAFPEICYAFACILLEMSLNSISQFKKNTSFTIYFYISLRSLCCLFWFSDYWTIICTYFLSVCEFSTYFAIFFAIQKVMNLIHFCLSIIVFIAYAFKIILKSFLWFILWSSFPVFPQ